MLSIVCALESTFSCGRSKSSKPWLLLYLPVSLPLMALNYPYAWGKPSKCTVTVPALSTPLLHLHMTQLSQHFRAHLQCYLPLTVLECPPTSPLQVPSQLILPHSLFYLFQYVNKYSILGCKLFEIRDNIDKDLNNCKLHNRRQIKFKRCGLSQNAFTPHCACAFCSQEALHGVVYAFSIPTAALTYRNGSYSSWNIFVQIAVTFTF